MTKGTPQAVISTDGSSAEPQIPAAIAEYSGPGMKVAISRILKKMEKDAETALSTRQMFSPAMYLVAALLPDAEGNTDQDKLASAKADFNHAYSEATLPKGAPSAEDAMAALTQATSQWVEENRETAINLREANDRLAQESRANQR